MIPTTGAQRTAPRHRHGRIAAKHALRLAVAGIAAAVAVAAAIWRDPAPAGRPPWETPAPEVSAAHAAQARELAAYLRRLPDGGGLHRARLIDWTQRWRNRPIGNLDPPALRRLLKGAWFVFRALPTPDGDGDVPRTWGVKHFDPTGTLWVCRDGKLQRYRYAWAADLVGAATYVTAEPDAERPRSGDAVYRPIAFEPETGTLAVYSPSRRPDGRWSAHIGHVERRFRAAFAAACPELPQPPHETASATAPRSYAAFRADAEAGGRIFRRVRTLFPQDPARPLAMGAFFALHPPPPRP